MLNPISSLTENEENHYQKDKLNRFTFDLNKVETTKSKHHHHFESNKKMASEQDTFETDSD